MIGQTISHYKILEKLGEGGMGIVYKAQDTKLERFVALKFLPPHLSASEQDKARFIQEAKAASALNHPNVCTIHDIQEHDDPNGVSQMFIVMELVEGQTLRERKGAVSFKQAVEIGIQVADGLAAAHEKGIVHRDIKPENIMVRKDGIVQIMDFGLAKLRGASRMTKEGSTVGTAGYMSPEQVQGLDADHRSDIFSLGVLIYELLTGQLPFKGVHETAIAYEIVNVDAPPMSSIKPDINPALDALILECLEKDPNERTQSVKQLAVDLRRYKRESSRQRASRIMPAQQVARWERPILDTMPAIARWRAWMFPGLSGVLALLLIIVAWSNWNSGSTSRLVARFGITLPKDLTLNILTQTAVAISPDGSRIVFRANGKLYQRNLESFNPVPIPGTDEGSSPFFSPDGRWIGFSAGGKLKKIPLNGGAPVTLTDAPDSRGASWANNGIIVLAAEPSAGLVAIQDAGGAVKQVSVLDTLENERTHRWPCVLPDGKTVICTVGKNDSPDYYEDATIVAFNIETGKRKLLLKGASTARYVAAGFLVYSQTGVLFAVPFDPDKLEIKGTSFPVVEDVSGDPTTGAMNYSMSDNGGLVYIPGQVNSLIRALVLLNKNGEPTRLNVPPQPFIEPRISPDGKRASLGIASGKDFDIWIFDLVRSTLSRMTFGGTNRTSAWSPDGKHIAYWSSNQGKNSVFIKKADGSGDAEEIYSGQGRFYVDCWSHDGSLLVLDRATGTGSDIYVLPLKGDRKPFPFLDTKFDEWQGALSPDGKWLAYVSNETGNYQVYIQPFPNGGGKWQVSAEEGFEPHWSPDGSTLYYITYGGMMSASIEKRGALTVGKPKVLFGNYRRLPLDTGISYDMAPDGQHFLTTRAKEGEEGLQQINIVLNWFDEIRKITASGK